MKPAILQAFLLSAYVCQGQAQTAVPIETVTISASRMEQPLREVGVSVSVLEAQQIQELGRISLADVLRTLPGLAVSNSGGLGKQSTLRIRGEEGFRTRVLVDGIDISDSSSTQIQAQLEHYLVSGIDRIEVLRGPQGMMYGADAGGVVNITTKQAESGLHAGFSMEYGSHETSQNSAYINGRGRMMDFSINLNELGSEGYNARIDDILLQDNDGYDNRSASASFGIRFNPQWRLDYGLHAIDSNTDFDHCFGPGGSSELCSSDFWQLSQRLGLEYQTDDFSHRISGQSNRTERMNFSDGSPGPAYLGKLDQLLYIASYHLDEGASVNFGLDHQRATLDDGSFYREREQNAFFAEWQGKVGENFFYTLGLRHDDNEDFGRHDSLRMSAAYLLDLPENLSLKLRSSVGNGFRAPSLYEEAYNQSVFAYPPASLQTLEEELSRGGDIGIELYGESGLRLEATYFYQRLEDAIEFDLVGFSGYLQSAGRSRASGLELAFSRPLTPNFGIDANYTYTDSQDSSGRQRIRRPRNLANLSLTYQSTGQVLHLRAGLRHSSGAVDEYYDELLFTNVRSDLDAYTVINLSASLRISQWLEAFGGVENLLDEDYMEIINYRVPGATFHAGFRLQY